MNVPYRIVSNPTLREALKASILNTLSAYAENLSEYSEEEREEVYDMHPLLARVDLLHPKPTDYAILASVCARDLIADAIEMMEVAEGAEDAEDAEGAEGAEGATSAISEEVAQMKRGLQAWVNEMAEGDWRSEVCADMCQIGLLDPSAPISAIDYAVYAIDGIPSLTRLEEEARAVRRSHRYHDAPSHPSECEGKTCPCQAQG